MKSYDVISADKKIFIVGYGRSGTTFLVVLLTRLNYFTGFKPYEEHFDNNKRAGCELSFILNEKALDKENKKELMRKTPFIIKSPDYSFGLREILEKDVLDIGHVLIPIRDINKAVQSRIDAKCFWGTTDFNFENQKLICATALGYSVEACISFDIPFTFMKFPQFIRDKEYCFQCLSRAIEGIDKKLFNKKFDELADYNKIKFK